MMETKKGKAMRGITRAWVLAVAAVAVAAPAWAQTELVAGAAGSVQLPVKGRIAARDGNQSMVFKVYDQARGGRLVYQEAQNVAVRGGVYFAMVGSNPGRGASPAAFGSERSLWVEAAAKGRPVGDRHAFRLVREEVGSETPANRGHAGLCFTCGGGYTRFSGSLQHPTEPAGVRVVEYGSACSGQNPVQIADSRPFVCSRAR